MITTIIDRALTILITGGIFAFIEFMVKRHDDKKDKKDGVQAMLGTIKSELALLKEDMDRRFRRSEKDEIRTQLLVMIKLCPDEQQEILTAAEHYFKDLKGNWYMTSIFNKWLEENEIAKPEWFKTN